jgi:transposase
VLYNDVSWQLLPLELGFGSGQTCWRRLGRWHEAGVFEKLHHILLAELHAADALDWTRACVDASHIRAKKGARPPARLRSTAGRRAVNTT